MEIISLPFALFCLTALIVYNLLPRRGQNFWLAFCSFYFAWSWRWDFAIILAISIVINFFLGKSITAAHNRRKTWLVAGIALNFVWLIFYRFAVIGHLDLLIRVLFNGQSLTTEILLPVGFSFYSLQAIAYLVDVYQKQISAEDDLVDFAVYLGYFPRLLSGPIERAKSFLSQLKNDRVVGNNCAAEGAWLVLLGLFRKLVLSALFATLIPDGVFTRPVEFAVSDRWGSLLVYSFWLYNDFAGYTSIVRGISLFFGIRLVSNFRQPFFARTFLEFWNRWHMSLSFWLRDYIFFPIQRAFGRRGYSSASPIRALIPPVITMLASGFWHSAAFSLAAWGLLHGIYQASDHITSQTPGHIIPSRQPRWRQIYMAFRVYLLLLPTWILFATGGLKLAASFSLSLFAGGGMLRIRPLEMAIPAIGLCVSLILDWLQEKNGENSPFGSFSSFAQSAFAALLVFCVILSILWSNIPSASFVYQGF